MRDGLFFAGRSQTELAEYLQVDRRKVNDWSRGKGTPGPEIIAKIARFLNIESDYLLDGTGQLLRQIHDIVAESKHEYSGYVLLPLVSSISKDLYDPANEIRRIVCDKLTVKTKWFFIEMPDDYYLNNGYKSIRKGDLLLIDPAIDAFYPGDLVAVVTTTFRQWVRFIDEMQDNLFYLNGKLVLDKNEIIAIYRVVRVRPKEFEV